MAENEPSFTHVTSSSVEPEHRRPPARPLKLTAIVLTYNEEKQIAECVESLAWADEILVFDSFSEDETVTAARAAGATVLQAPFENYAHQRNAALDAVETDWVFFVDADERGTVELAAEIRRVIRERAENAWYVPRHNIIFGKLMRGAGWYPDYQLRLLRHGFVSFERPVHEIANVQGEKGHLRNPLLHYNYEDKQQFQAKQGVYTSYDAGILFQDGVRPRPQNFFLQPWRQFWWRFVTLAGYKDGRQGLRLSIYMAYYEAVKYRKLAQLWRQSR